MVKYNSDRQLTIEEFKTPFQASFLADNPWVKLSKAVPWDKIERLPVSTKAFRATDVLGYQHGPCPTEIYVRYKNT